ncbi:MAG: hypothetical protein ACRDN8_06825 [Thermoleophilaceae bacterium]
MSRRSEANIDQLLEAFLDERREALSERTFRNYAQVVELLRHSLNGYGHSSLDRDERRRFEAAYEAGDEQAFCHLFGPEKIPEHLGEFLGYFMVRKVMAGQELLRASGTVTRKLVQWLEANGHVDAVEARQAEEHASNASRDLPLADRLGEILHDVAASAPHLDLDAVAEEDFVENHLAIADVEPGRIWFEDGVGPVEVPRAASDLARPGWSMFVTAVRTGQEWHLLEVGFVYP